MNSFWSAWVIVLTTVSVIGVLWILLANRKTTKRGEDQKTGHEYDGIEEYDNPLPGWWMYMFLASIVFAIAYLVAYPGMGNFSGMLGWTQQAQYEKEMNQAEDEFLAGYNAFEDKTIEGLAANPKAVKMGQRLFSNNCSVCHGADARGTTGYPNLADHDWLWGGASETIKQTIVGGRVGAMPAWEGALGQQRVQAVAQYAKALSEGRGAEAGVSDGKVVFDTFCSACHGANGEGNVAIGAPNLTDNVWLYGGSLPTITESISKGRNGRMPAHGELLSEERIQLISAYVYSLSQGIENKSSEGK